MTELIIKRKNGPYNRLLISAPVAIFFIARSFINNLNSTSASKSIIAFLLGTFLLLCLAFFINAIIQVLKKTPAIIINENGLLDMVSLAKAGQIKWENIISCEIEKFTGTPHLFIKLKDFTSIVSNQNGFKKMMIKKLLRDKETPIAINLILIDFEPHELKRIIDEKIIVPLWQ